MKKILKLCFLSLTVILLFSACERQSEFDKEMEKYQKEQEAANESLKNNSLLNGKAAELDAKVEDLKDRLAEAEKNNDYDEKQKIEDDLNDLIEEYGE